MKGMTCVHFIYKYDGNPYKIIIIVSIIDIDCKMTCIANLENGDAPNLVVI
jgi:hypothetical protein